MSVKEIPPATRVALNYAEDASGVAVTATALGSATNIITAGAITVDGSTRINVEFQSPHVQPADTSGSRYIDLVLTEGATVVGAFARLTQVSPSQVFEGTWNYSFIPTAGSHTYSVRGYLGAGGATSYVVGDTLDGIARVNRILITRV